LKKKWFKNGFYLYETDVCWAALLGLSDALFTVLKFCHRFITIELMSHNLMENFNNELEFYFEYVC